MKRLIIYPIIFCSMILGFFFPFGEQVKWLIPYLLAFLLFLGFLNIDITLKDFLNKEVLLYGIISIIIMPVFSYFTFKHFFNFDDQVGLFLLAIAPTGFSLSGLINLIPKGDRKFVIAILIIYTLLSAFLIPILVFVYFKKNVEINILNLIFRLVLLIFIPWTIAKILKFTLKKRLLEKINDKSYIINFILLFLIIYVAIGGAKNKIQINLSIIYIFIGVMFIYFFQSFIGFLLARFFSAKHIPSFTVTCSSKNTQLALIVALMNFGELAAIAPVIGIIGNHLTFSILLIFFHLSNRIKNNNSSV